MDIPEGACAKCGSYNVKLTHRDDHVHGYCMNCEHHGICRKVQVEPMVYMDWAAMNGGHYEGPKAEKFVYVIDKEAS